MNQLFAGVTALIIALILWGFGKKPKGGLIATTNPKTIEGLNEQNISLVKTRQNSRKKAKSNKPLTEDYWQPPTSVRDKKNLQKYLNKLISGGPEERLKAINIAQEWKNSSVLTILRRGLKDSDSRVVIAAASAMQKYRGVPNTEGNQEVGSSLPPRNVALMR